MKLPIATNKLFTATTSNTTLSAEEALAISEYQKAAISENTERAYQNALMQFIKLGFGLPTTSDGMNLFAHKLQMRGCKPSTIDSYVKSVSVYQKRLGFSDPYTNDVQQTLSGIRRLNPKQDRKGSILSIQEVFAIVDNLNEDNSITTIRNRALFLCVFWTLGRTEEVANFTFEKTTIDLDKITLHTAKSKNRQEGEGLTKTIPKLYTGRDQSEKLKRLCPWLALNEYIDTQPYQYQGLFKRLNRSGRYLDKSISHRSIREIIRSILIKAGISEERAAEINGHSFRHTVADLGSQIGLSNTVIQKLGGWDSLQPLSTYSGEHSVNAIKKIGDMLSTIE